jgi:hypothetical protein
LTVAIVVFGLLLGTTAFGADDHFPFAPFRMYARYRAPSQSVEDTRIIGLTGSGARTFLHERNSGIRRAEIEGQEPLYVAEPQRLARIAEAYNRKNPEREPVVRVILEKRWHGVEDGRPTGRTTTENIVEWTAQ